MSDTKRVSIDFGIPAYEKLVSMKVRTGSTTLSSVIRDALRFYNWALEEQSKGYTISAIKETDDKLRIKEVTV